MSIVPVGTDGDDRVAYLFLDTETTGLRTPSKYGIMADQVWDIAWTLEIGESLMVERQMYVDHNTKPCEWTLDPKNSEYTAVMESVRRFEAHLSEPRAVCKALASDIAAVMPAQVYLVGANPAFDQEFVNAMGMVHQPYSWHFRLIDLEARIAGRLNLATNPGLSECARLLGLPEPPKNGRHTARGDVKLTRWLFWEFRRACAEGRI